MKRLTYYLSFFLLTAPLAVVAQAPARDALIERVAGALVSANPVEADSKYLKIFLDPQRTANPNVDEETWAQIAKELAVKLNAILTGKTSPTGVALRLELSNFSDSELLRLDQILSDPLLLRVQGVLKSPRFKQSLEEDGLNSLASISSALTEILTNHGLRVAK